MVFSLEENNKNIILKNTSIIENNNYCDIEMYFNNI